MVLKDFLVCSNWNNLASDLLPIFIPSRPYLWSQIPKTMIMIQFIHSQDIFLCIPTTQTNSFSGGQISYRSSGGIHELPWTVECTVQLHFKHPWLHGGNLSHPAGSSEIFLLLLPFHSQCGGHLECSKHCTVQITCAMQCRTELSHLVVDVELLPDLHPVCELLGQGHLHGCVNHQVLKQVWTAYFT